MIEMSSTAVLFVNWTAQVFATFVVDISLFVLS